MAESPGDGTDVLALFHAAGTKLSARRFVRGEWRPSAESAGLVASVEDLAQRRVQER